MNSNELSFGNNFNSHKEVDNLQLVGYVPPGFGRGEDASGEPDIAITRLQIRTLPPLFNSHHPPNCRRGSFFNMASRLGQRTSFMV